jgi:uncharacterized membrane protein YhaH (DUF805 family)
MIKVSKLQSNTDMTEETVENQEHVGKDFRGRIGQLDFLFRFIVYVVALIPIKAIIQIPENLFASLLGFLLLLAATYWMLTFSVKRAHDFGMSGSTGWLTLIPVINLFWFVVLLLRDSDQVSNQYGPPPKQSATKIERECEPTPVATTETERQLEDLRTLHEKGLLSREAYTTAQLDVLNNKSKI